jgi:signal transduction histidine kinase/ActR/RegA family two-component response regulator/HPt (histidine-containing phosphotransfer) domain-containing protein
MSTPELDHDQLPVGLLLLDARQMLLQVNAYAAELVGRPVDELLGRRIDELLAPASRLLFHSHIVPALQLHRRVDEVELTLLTPGPRQAAMFHAVLDQDAQGEQRIHAVLMRLGERRRLEEPLRPAQRAADQLPGMLFQLLLNAQGVWAMPYASDGLRRLHGLTPELVREQLGPWWGSLHPQDRSALEAGLRASADALVDWRARYRSLAGRRELWVQSRATPQRLADGSVLWHGYSEDITELLQQEQAHQQQLAADAVNRAMSEFLTTMSDEIRTPLHAMLGLTEQLQRDRPSARQAQQLARIADCGRHLLEVVNNVLDVTRIEAGRFELDALDFDLAGLCEQVLQQVADPARSKGLQLSLDLADTPLAWCGDVARLRQALLNLASNAVQFTERGTVQMRVRLQPASRVDQTGARLLQFELIDSGSGLDAPALARLFEPFAQADRSITRHPGRSGLGLVITRRLARLMHGDAGASSTPGVGSRFWFTARLVPGTPSSAAPAGASELEAQLRRCAAGLRVLVADDHPLNRELTADLLGAVQLGVDLACDGLQALTLVEQADPPHALVLMDLQMPQLDGLAATRAIRRLPGRANLPIIAMTAKALDSDRAACLDAGMNDHVAKPVDPNLLYATLLRWLPLAVAPGDGSTGAGRPAANHNRRLADRLSGVSGLDLVAALRNVGGQSGVLARVLERFIKTYAPGLPEFTRPFDPALVPAWRAASHSLRGACGALGAGALESDLLDFERRLGDAPDALQLASQAGELHERLKLLVQQLQAALSGAST